MRAPWGGGGGGGWGVGGGARQGKGSVVWLVGRSVGGMAWQGRAGAGPSRCRAVRALGWRQQQKQGRPPRQRCAHLACRPTSLPRAPTHALRHPRTHRYWVTWKADGTRYMLLLLRWGTYLIDRKCAVRRVQMRWPMPLHAEPGQDPKRHAALPHHWVSAQQAWGELRAGGNGQWASCGAPACPDSLAPPARARAAGPHPRARPHAHAHSPLRLGRRCWMGRWWWTRCWRLASGSGGS